jgi:hypothetical protein
MITPRMMSWLKGPSPSFFSGALGICACNKLNEKKTVLKRNSRIRIAISLEKTS